MMSKMLDFLKTGKSYHILKDCEGGTHMVRQRRDHETIKHYLPVLGLLVDLLDGTRCNGDNCHLCSIHNSELKGDCLCVYCVLDYNLKSADN